jgi:membrane protein YdbS with pleckstrin-like domain
MPDKPPLPGVDPPLSVVQHRNESSGQQDQADRAETDVWWGAYAGRTMLPGFLLCLLLTAILLGLDLYLKTAQRRSELVSSAVSGVAGAIWLFQGTRWVYRMTAVNYRLTNRRLLFSRGFKLPDTWAIELERIADVSVVAGPVERLLGVGTIQVRVQDGGSPLFVLDGVLAPERVARIIRRRVRQARLTPNLKHCP